MAIFLSLVYPTVGMWKWGGGFLDALSVPFYDFAGSTIVHSVGGWAALAGVLILGARHGRYDRDRREEFRPGDQSLMCIGAFLLWFGWYGFNGGSVLSADPAALSLVFVTTSIAAAAGVIGAMIVSRYTKGFNDLGSALNGALGGLVGITAGADVMGPMSAALCGAIGGIVVVLGSSLLERLKIDDPVGAIPVHLFAGIWGTLAVGIFGTKASLAQFASQLSGVIAVGAFTFTVSYALFSIVQKLYPMRVSHEEEEIGLDLIEHGSLRPASSLLRAEGAGK
jgi:Amt family ammonium transporter